MITLRTINGSKVKVEQIHTFDYRNYGLFRDKEGKLYYQFTDECEVIAPCLTGDVDEEIKYMEEALPVLEEEY